MSDEKIDRKWPVQAESEPKPIQQRHVDETVDDSFPASDPPAWTTSGTKSVAAECEPDALNEAPTPPGHGLADGAGSAVGSMASQASEPTGDTYQRGQGSVEQGRGYRPDAREYYRQGTQAMSRPVQEHPLIAVLAAGVLGCAAGWLLARRTAEAAPARQWHPGSSHRPREPHIWRPAPRAVTRGDGFSAHDEVEVASHTNNSF